MTVIMVVANIAGIWAGVTNAGRDNYLGFIAAIALLWGIYILEAAWIRLVVTSENVRMISIRMDPPVSREQISYIRAWRLNTVFYGYDRKPILETRADLTQTQLLALANELGVNVWDHRAWHGLKELKHGVRLNPEPFPHRPPT